MHDSLRLLIITQKVDRDDPILGFFHRWLQEFAAQSEQLVVIGQMQGAHALPSTATVVSMGKEDGIARWRQILRFWRHAWQLRNEYDAVLVHMTPIWMVLGGPLWMFLGKRRYLWYEVKRGSRMLSMALLFVHKVFSATAHGLPLQHRKQVITGHGIDTDLFKPDCARREPRHVVAVGRVTRVKRYDVLLHALAALPDCTLTIAGGTITADDKVYEQELKELMQELSMEDKVQIAWVAPDQLPDLLQRADVMLHAGAGGLDKVVLEAMACGCPVVSCSDAARAVLPDVCLAPATGLADYARSIFAMTPEERAQLDADMRQRALSHALTPLVRRLTDEML